MVLWGTVVHQTLSPLLKPLTHNSVDLYGDLLSLDWNGVWVNSCCPLIDISIYFKDISLKLQGRKVRKSIIAVNSPNCLNSWQNNSPDANWTHYP